MKLNETQKAIVRLLFLNKTMSRKRLAEALNLSNPGLTLASKALIDEKIVSFAPKVVTGKAGRNEEPLCLNAKYGFFVGIDVLVNVYRFTLIALSGYTVYECDFNSVAEVMDKLHYFVTNIRVLNVCVTFPHYGCYKPMTARENEIYEAFKSYKEAPLCFENNVVAMGDIHYLYNHVEQTSLLVKYGPELNAAIMEDGKVVRNKKGECSRIGLTYLSEGCTISEKIGFSSLFGKECEEVDGIQRILGDEAMLAKVLDTLALTIFNADRFFVFDEIVFAGPFLSNETVKEGLLARMKKMSSDFAEEKVSSFVDYEEMYRCKAALEAFIYYFAKHR